MLPCFQDHVLGWAPGSPESQMSAPGAVAYAVRRCPFLAKNCLPAIGLAQCPAFLAPNYALRGPPKAVGYMEKHHAVLSAYFRVERSSRAVLQVGQWAAQAEHLHVSGGSIACRWQRWAEAMPVPGSVSRSALSRARLPPTTPGDLHLAGWSAAKAHCLSLCPPTLSVVNSRVDYKQHCTYAA